MNQARFSTNDLLAFLTANTMIAALKQPAEPFTVVETHEVRFDPRRRKDILQQIQARIDIPQILSSTTHISNLTVWGNDELIIVADVSTATAVIESLSRKSAPQQVRHVLDGLTEVNTISVDTIQVISTRIGRQGYMNSFTTNVECPAWIEIAPNYARRTRDTIDIIMAREELAANGRLMVWNGAPGTGKTFALRALLRHLAEKYIPIYVSDPDTFLTDASYYFQAIAEFSDRALKSGNQPGSGRILFILEDSVSALLTESRGKEGSPVSKLLNLTDGLLTRARNDLFLITFNEAIEQLDPAIIRPGRCMAHVIFTPLDQEEAAVWLNAHGSPTSGIPTPATIAQLYAHISGGIIMSEDQSGVGF